MTAPGVATRWAALSGPCTSRAVAIVVGRGKSGDGAFGAPFVVLDHGDAIARSSSSSRAYAPRCSRGMAPASQLATAVWLVPSAPPTSRRETPAASRMRRRSAGDRKCSARADALEELFGVGVHGRS